MAQQPQTIELKGPGGAGAAISTHGATLLSWRNTAGKELLFLSGKAIMDGSKAIRGGVPVCFPQFGNLGPVPAQHGFARTCAWEVESRTADAATLRLVPGPDQLAAWPHPFQLRMTVVVGDDRLSQELVLRNTGERELQFTTALHTYFRVSDISAASVIGLQGCNYHDNLSGERRVDDGAAVRFGAELDRVYLAAPDVLKVADATTSTAVVVRKHGLADAVVWNPWEAKAAGMPDLDGFRCFCCLEVAQARSGPVAVAPGGEARWGQVLEAVEHTDI